MKHFYLLLFVTLSLLLASCDWDFTTPDEIPTNLQATTAKNYSVNLNWTVTLSSQVAKLGMTLERKTADGEFVSLGDVSGKTSYEDFPVFDDVTYTYRLKGGGQSSEVTVSIPAVTPNPLTVTLTPEADKSVKQTIGTAGGSISATGANGVIYTLTIPADALLNDTEITLTPISQIGNLPLSGGLLGAVKIEPEDLEFYNYTTLSITSTPAVSTGMKAVGFSSGNTGQEFYLYPFAASASPSGLQAQQDDDDLAPIRPIKGGTYGAGSGTAQDVKKQIQDNPPTDSTSQTQQQTVVEDDDLAPLQTPTQLASGWATSLMIRELNRPSSQTLSVFKEFRQWLEYLRTHNLEKDFDSQIKAHSQRQATRISKRFDELYQQCEAGDRNVRKEMRELFHWSKLYPALVQNLGSAWFSEAQDRVEMCGIPNWEGTASFNAEGILSGYSGSADITYIVDTVQDDVVNYSATATNIDITINSGNGCTATVNSVTANPDSERSFLVVDYSSNPANYIAGFAVFVNFTISCPNTSQTYDSTFPILLGFDGEKPLSNNNQVIAGSYDIPQQYSGTWTFAAVPRSNP